MRIDGGNSGRNEKNKKKFQLGVLDMQIEQEASIMPEDFS
jgi:hypothetical protein